MDISIPFHLGELNILVPNSSKLAFVWEEILLGQWPRKSGSVAFCNICWLTSSLLYLPQFYCCRCQQQTCSWLSLCQWYTQKRKRLFQPWPAIFQLTKCVERSSTLKMLKTLKTRGIKTIVHFFAALAETALWTSSGLRIRLLATAFIWNVTLTHFINCSKFVNLVFLCWTALLKKGWVLWHFNIKSWATCENLTKKNSFPAKGRKQTTQSKGKAEVKEESKVRFYPKCRACVLKKNIKQHFSHA